MTHGFVHWYMCIFVYTYINIILYLKSCKPMSNIDIVSGLMSWQPKGNDCPLCVIIVLFVHK